MKNVIIYDSKNGATKQYAEWLSEQTGFPAMPHSKIRKLNQYDTIVMGSCIRMYTPTMGAWIKKQWRILSTKRTLLFTVAGALANDPKRIEWVEKALGAEIAALLPHFALNGKMEFKTMRWLDRTLLKMGIKMIAKKNPAEAEAMAREFNHVNKADLKPILEFLNTAK